VPAKATSLALCCLGAGTLLGSPPACQGTPLPGPPDALPSPPGLGLHGWGACGPARPAQWPKEWVRRVSDGV